MPNVHPLAQMPAHIQTWWSTKRFSALAAALLAFVMPIHQKVAVLALMILGLITLASFRQRRPKNMRSFLPMLLLYALYALGMFHSDHALAGHHPGALEQKMSLVIFPWIAWLIHPMTSQERRSISWVFVGGVGVFALLAFGAAAMRYTSSAQTGEFVYSKLALGFHPTYMASYAALALAIVLEGVWFQKLKGKWMLVLAGLLVMFVVFLSSKAGLLCTGVLIVLLLFVRSVRMRVFGMPWFQGLALLLILFALPRFVPGADSRVKEFTQGIERQTDAEALNNSVARTSTQVRFLAWQCSIELMIENPLGVGTDDVTPALMEQYDARGETFAYEKKLNAHNQYLETGVELGWPGLLALLAMMALGLRQAVLNKDVLFQALLFIAGFNMLFESYLELQSGIVFLLFFWMLFLNRERPAITPPPAQLQSS